MIEKDRSPRRLFRRLSRLLLVALPAILGLVLIGVALTVSGNASTDTLTVDNAEVEDAEVTVNGETLSFDAVRQSRLPEGASQK